MVNGLKALGNIFDGGKFPLSLSFIIQKHIFTFILYINYDTPRKHCNYLLYIHGTIWTIQHLSVTYIYRSSVTWSIWLSGNILRRYTNSGPQREIQPRSYWWKFLNVIAKQHMPLFSYPKQLGFPASRTSLNQHFSISVCKSGMC